MKLLRIFKRLLIYLVRFIKKHWLIVFIIIFIFTPIILFSIFYLEYTGKLNSYILEKSSLRFLEKAPKLLDILYLPKMVGSSQLPVYKITVDRNDLDKIFADIPFKACCECLPKSSDKYIPAIFQYDSKDYEVRIKLRGDCHNHFIYEKKSWKINFSKDEPFEGYDQTHLIIPLDREFYIEALNFHRAKKLGLNVPPSKFVRLEINGKNYGVYWENKQLGQEFLEQSAQSPDVNLYEDRVIDDDLFYDLGKWQKETFNPLVSKDDFSELDYLLNLINHSTDEEFYSKIPLIIDLDNFYRWSVLNVLAGSYHQDWAHNVNIYFDNTTGKFKFIPFDVGISTFKPLNLVYLQLQTRIFKNPKFAHERYLILWNYVKDESNLQDDLSYLNELYEKTKLDFYRDRTKIYSNLYFDKKNENKIKLLTDHFYNAQSYFKNAYADGITAIIDFSKDNKVGSVKQSLFSVRFVTNNLVSADFQKLSFESESIRNQQLNLYVDSNQNFQFDDKDRLLYSVLVKSNQVNFEIEDNHLFSQRIIPEPIIYKRDFEGSNLFKEIISKPTENYFFVAAAKNIDLQNDLSNLNIELMNSVTKKPIKARIITVNKSSFNSIDKAINQIDEFINNYQYFIKVDENTVELKAGYYKFSQDIIIPQSVKLIIRAGADIFLNKDVSLISYGQIEALAESEKPIKFRPLKADQNWGVVAIINQPELSEFQNVIFESGKDKYINGIYFSGMLSAYYSEVAIDSCRFFSAQADDALNIKYGGVSVVKNSYFVNNSADAIDYDWTDGRIENNYFSKNGGDAIDISGYQPLIYGNFVNESGDKCVSLGEKTDAQVVNNVLKGCLYGIAVKDSSQVLIVNNTIINNGTGIGLYQKKVIFGGGQAEVYNTIIWDNDEQITLDDESKIIISHSDIDGGFGGENNFNQQPVFINQAANIFMLKKVQENEILFTSGNLDIINRWEKNLSEPIIGIFDIYYPQQYL